MELTEYKQEGRTSKNRLINRERLYKLFNKTPIPVDQLLVSLGLYMRSSALTKVLFINELYQKILNIPGVIMEFGIWWGQNIVLFENLRAIYEPFNYDRRIIGFDTFSGYSEISDEDIKSDVIKEGGYTVSKDYDKYLKELIDYHEQENVLYYGSKHKLIKGNVQNTIGEFLKKEPQIIIALAYLDLALYEPTKKCLEEIRYHLIRGSIVVIDGLNSSDYPGETIALKETWGLKGYHIYKSKFMPGRSYIVID